MKIVQFFEGKKHRSDKPTDKKTHAECSDEIDAHHAETVKHLKKAAKVACPECAPHIEAAMTSLKKAIDLAKNWNHRCA